MIVRVSAPQAALAVHGHLSWLVTDTPHPGPVGQPINVAADRIDTGDDFNGSLLGPQGDDWWLSFRPVDGIYVMRQHPTGQEIIIPPGHVVGSVTPTTPSVPIVDSRNQCGTSFDDSEPHVCVGNDVVLYDGEDDSDISGQILDPTPGQWATPINNPAPCEERCPECWGQGGYIDQIYESIGDNQFEPAELAVTCSRCNGAGRCEPWPWAGNTEWDET